MKIIISMIAMIISTVVIANDSLDVTLKNDGLRMPVRLEVQQTDQGSIPSLNSLSVTYLNFRQQHKVSMQGVHVDFDTPIDNEIGARLIIVLSGSNARLIYYNDDLGNVGANIESYNYNESNGRISFDKGDLQRAFRSIYDKMITYALSKSYNLDDVRMCSDVKIASSMICEPGEVEYTFNCSMGAMEYRLSTSCN